MSPSKAYVRRLGPHHFAHLRDFHPSAFVVGKSKTVCANYSAGMIGDRLQNIDLLLPVYFVHNTAFRPFMAVKTIAKRQQ